MSILNEIKQQYKTGDVSQKLIFINILVFIISALCFSFVSNQFQYPNWLALSSNYKDVLWFPWTLFTYGFFHSEPIHLLFNLIFLYYISTLFYTFFNTKQFLTVYFLGSFFAGLIFVAFGYFFNYSNLIVGASASIMAVFIAVVTFVPSYSIRLPLLGYFKIWHLAFFYIFLDVVQLLTENTGGHIAHLSGAAVGFAFSFLIKKGFDLSEIFTIKKKKNNTFKKIYKNKPIKKYQSARVSDVNFTQRQIDEILEKISKSGYESLTKEEKEFLFAANK